MLRELDTEALEGRPVHAGDEPFNNIARLEFKARKLGQDGAVDGHRTGRGVSDKGRNSGQLSQCGRSGVPDQPHAQLSLSAPFPTAWSRHPWS